ncbi:MAG: ferredoxin reductase [Solirubrobacteraceae bacterium]
MAGAALLGRLTPPAPLRWQPARIASVRAETPSASTLALEVPDWPGHRAGQHLDVRLTAEDGYRAQRSYSIASSPQDPMLEITVERLEDGEVSPWLAGDAQAGDELELRGPIGGYFVWAPERGGPLLLIAGGSGLVPLMCIERLRRAAAPEIASTLLISARRPEDLIYAEELRAGSAVVTYTREQPAGWTGYARRVDRDMLAEVAPPAGGRPHCYVCGPTGFVEVVAEALVDLGHHRALIKTERFGATGG